MPRQSRPLPSTVDVNAFTVASALANGATRRRLRAKDLTAPFHGVRVAGRSDSWEAKLRAYAVRMPDGGRFSHTTAALLHGMRMPSGHIPDSLHVTVPTSRRAPRVRGTVGHRLANAGPPVPVRGLEASAPVQAWLECSTLLTADDLVIMGDGLLRRHAPVASLHELEAAVRAHGNARGARRLREALELVRSGTDSPMETVLRVAIIRWGFEEPEVNGEVVVADRILHGDLVFRDARVVVEYDGKVHEEAAAYFADICRLDAMMEAGWRVIRVDRSLMAQPLVLRAKLQRALGGF
jgi:very-short-patch-repair endonuclease